MSEVCNTPITLDKDRTTINKFGNIGPERSGSLLDVHTTQYSQAGTGVDHYGHGQAWRAWPSFEHVQNLRGQIVGLSEHIKHALSAV